MRPAAVARLLDVPGLDYLLRLALASPFLISGVVKLLDFSGATAEVAGLGVQPAVPVAVAVIATELVGSALFLTRRWCWLGAGLLAGFTVVATLLAHAFWTFDGPERARQAATFFEHVSMIGGLGMAALLAARAVLPR
nr:DoxX family protein [Rhodoplanes tepidamans]